MEHAKEIDRGLYRKLMCAMETELAQPVEQMDDEVVALCADCLTELDGKTALPFEEVRRRLRTIGLYRVPPLQKKRRLRRILIAAVIAILLMLLSMATFGTDTLNDFWRKQYKDMEIGESTIVDGDVVAKEAAMREYDSFEAFRKAEQLDLLFPTQLPGQLTLKEIDVSDVAGVTTVAYVTNDPRFSYVIRIHADLSFLETDLNLREEINGLDCRLFNEQDVWQINFAFEDNLYSVVAPTYEDARFIVAYVQKSGGDGQ